MTAAKEEKAVQCYSRYYDHNQVQRKASEGDDFSRSILTFHAKSLPSVTP